MPRNLEIFDANKSSFSLLKAYIVGVDWLHVLVRERVIYNNRRRLNMVKFKSEMLSQRVCRQLLRFAP